MLTRLSCFIFSKLSFNLNIINAQSPRTDLSSVITSYVKFNVHLKYENFDNKTEIMSNNENLCSKSFRNHITDA